MSDRQLSTLPASHFDGRLDELRKALPEKTITAEMLVRTTLTAINKTPALRECSEASLLGCMMDLATLALVPNTPLGHAYLIPYGGQATLQIGYRGYAELTYRSGQVKIIKSAVVRAGDEFTYGVGTGDNAFVRHIPRIGKGRSNSELLAAWAAVEMMNGGNAVEIMDADELGKIEALANSKKASPAWKQWGDELRKKSCLKRLLKVLQIGNMDTVAKAVEIDAKHSEFEPFAPKEHRLTFEDAPRLEAPALETALLTNERDDEPKDAEGNYLF